ncbi:transposase [Microcoleus sp. B3-A4]|uniref:RNA-guided endonuclease TnpB family protein n=1 Tax=Microcoleus sp. B3-A4 TaxID=2818653 RepID=UPI002FD41255
MIVVERPYIDGQHQFYKQFDDLSFLSINFYYHGQYYMRKHFFTSGDRVGSTRIIRQLSSLLEPTDSSQLFPAKISNQVLKQLIYDRKDCQKSIIAYERELPRFSCLPCLPPYQHKIWGSKVFVHDNQSLKKREHYKNNELLHLSQNDTIISTKSPNAIKIRRGFTAAIYFIEVANQKPVTLVYLNYHFRPSIHLGIDNLVVLASNKPTVTPPIYDKKNLKSINQGFNQRRPFLQSKLDRGKSTTRQIQQITFNRNKRLENYLPQTTSLIIKRLVGEKKNQLIVGTNVRYKQNLKLQKKHKRFVVITPTQVIKFITYKTALFGVKVIVRQGSYTNKRRFWDLEPVGKQESYQGKRGKHGWFRFFNESRINADVNPALNMIIKVNANSPLEECHNRIYMSAISPVRVDPVRK